MHPNQEAWGGRGKPWGVDAQPSPAGKGKGARGAKKGRAGGGHKNPIEVEDTTFKSCGRRPSGGRPSLPTHPIGERGSPPCRPKGHVGPVGQHVLPLTPPPGEHQEGGTAPVPSRAQQGAGRRWDRGGRARDGKEGRPTAGRGARQAGRVREGGHTGTHTAPPPHSPTTHTAILQDLPTRPG